jgi:hypothetical protein
MYVTFSPWHTKIIYNVRIYWMQLKNTPRHYLLQFPPFNPRCPTQLPYLLLSTSSTHKRRCPQIWHTTSRVSHLTTIKWQELCEKERLVKFFRKKICKVRRLDTLIHYSVQPLYFHFILILDMNRDTNELPSIMEELEEDVNSIETF